MFSMQNVPALAVLAFLALAACSDKDPQLMRVGTSGDGPDEFAILPSKPLENPTDYASLPQPTPGGANRTDPTPTADAVAALGGKPSRLEPVGVARADSTVVSYASRYGVTNNIRPILASEDLEYRKKNNARLLERWFNVSVYFKAYEKMSLDQQAELARFRKAGIPTPSAPPVFTE